MRDRLATLAMGSIMRVLHSELTLLHSLYCLGRWTLACTSRCGSESGNESRGLQVKKTRVKVSARARGPRHRPHSPPLRVRPIVTDQTPPLQRRAGKLWQVG